MQKQITALILVSLLSTLSLAETYTGEPSNRVKINLGETPWKFIKSDPANAQDSGFNDASWATVGIPHTWNDTNTFLNMSSGGNAGALLGNTGWYRKHFTLDNGYAGRKIFVEFEGAHIGCQVYVNGVFIPGNSAVNPQATHVIGFLPFVVDVTPYVQFGGADNVLAVRVSTGSSWFTYPGFSVDFRFGQGDGGLFRPVWLHITDRVHVPLNVFSVVNNWGTCVGTTAASDASATVRILTNVQNEGGAAATVSLTTKVVDATGTVVLSLVDSRAVSAGTCQVFDQSGNVANPHLWYPAASTYGTPYMYKVYHIVKVNGSTVDVFTSPLGIRTLTWNTDFPIFNGHPHYLWGAAGRYDYPALGTAVPEEQQWRDVKILTECGGRYWRPGHSTCSPEFVDACDAFGVMIIQPSGDNEGTWMTENYNAATSPYNQALKSECHRDMIVRDRNHPCILAWECANAPIDHAYNVTLMDTLLKYDAVAPRRQSDRGNDKSDIAVDSVTSCSLDGCEAGLKSALIPSLPAYGAEGFYNHDTRFDYDGELAFAQTFAQNWKNGKRVKAFGMCQWYMAESPGEDGTGRNFASSMMDWNRIPKMLYKIYAACWTPYSIKPVVYLAHHWNRSGAITVNAFSNCPSVRLRINGSDQGTQVPYPDTGNGSAMMPDQCSWNVTWAAGTLRAEGLDASGNTVCFDEKITAGNPDHVALTVEPELVKPSGEAFAIFANGTDAAFILATIVDASGNWCPTASNIVHFTVTGPGNYRGGADQMVGSGGANYHSPGDPELSAEGGMCKVAVRSTFTPGTITVTATSSGLGGGSASFTTIAVPPPPPVALVMPRSPTSYHSPVAIRIGTVGKTIRYCIDRPAFVSVQVLDVEGKTVVSVPASMQTQGWHVATGATHADLPNGIYVVRCAVDNQRLAKRVVIAR
ncbi:MAG TPA: DUF4982 domain-containing protein [Chitinivibrionales bacterium]|nr:DUF4982 domain-containing protein [Chitinivibrionales bacterium]